jgi:flagellar P-ring protein FlgI
MKRPILLFALVALIALTLVPPAGAARLKDIASFGGVRANDLVGYGLVVGLAKSGDGNSMRSTTNSILNMLSSMGVKVEQRDIKSGNVAAVMVMAKLPAFSRTGQRLDVTVSSIGDAKSLQGGILVMCPLKGADGRVYAVAQGSVSIGGFAAGGGGDSVVKNHPTAGMVPNGALVEREVVMQLNNLKEITVALDTQDFTTAARTAAGINHELGGTPARAVDSRTIKVDVPAAYTGNIPSLLARIETVDVVPETIAKVVVNERTGTVVMGSNVRLSPVAIAHGNIHVQISTTPIVSQPGALSGGDTVVTQDTKVVVSEDAGQLFILPGQSTIGDLVTSLNAVGISPRDLVAILQAIKSAGALQAQLEII